MSSEELVEKLTKLGEELSKQRERECYEGMVKEYLRVKKMVADFGALTHDECCKIALRICDSKQLFSSCCPW